MTRKPTHIFKHNMSHMLHKNFPKSNSIQTSFAHHGRIKNVSIYEGHELKVLIFALNYGIADRISALVHIYEKLMRHNHLGRSLTNYRT